MKKRTPFIEQMEHSECGLACFGMILGSFGHYTTLPELRDIFGSSKKGISIHNLMEMGVEFNLETNVYEADVAGLNYIKLPAILYWEEKHYVVLDEISPKGNDFTIIDPAYGRRKIRSDEFLEKYSGFVLEYSLTEDFVKKKKKYRFNFFLTHVLKHKKILLFLLFTSLVLQGIGLIMPKLTQWVIDQIILTSDNKYINLLGMSVLILYLFYQSFSVLRGYLIARLQTLIDSSLMTTFIKKLFRLPFSFFEARTSGDLVHRANSNYYIRQILSSNVIAVVIDSLLIIGYATMMLYMSLKLTLLVFIISSFIVVNILFSTRFIRQISDKNLTDQSKTQSYLTESIYGISDVKVLGVEEKIYEKWHGLFKKYLKTSQKQSFLSTSLESIGSSFQFITPIVILWVGSSMVINGTLTLGELLAFTAFANSFMVPIVSIGSTYSHFVMLGSFTQRLQDVMDTESERSGGKVINKFKGNISLRNVSFKYDHFGGPILSDINMEVQSGEKIAIVGSSGSGKSSLAKIILGLNHPTSGMLTYDGVDVNQLDLQLLRKSIGSVLQETRLFHGSILENIQAFNDNISLDRVIKAAKIAEIHEDILMQPMGYNTIISEGGSNFSGGQRQRLLIARALINNPQLLVLDEATSALDNITESRIKENLSQLNCTQVIIAHRLSTIINSDRILVMSNGEIIESGTHTELLNKKGFYYDLYFVKKEKKRRTYCLN